MKDSPLLSWSNPPHNQCSTILTIFPSDNGVPLTMPDWPEAQVHRRTRVIESRSSHHSCLACHTDSRAHPSPLCTQVEIVNLTLIPITRISLEITHKLPARSRPIPGALDPTGSNPYYTLKDSLRGERLPHF
jgi:hypothetical protein